MLGEFSLRPTHDAFDEAKIADFLQTFTFTEPDPIKPHVFTICGDTASLNAYQEARMQAKHDAVLPYLGCLVQVQPHQVAVNQYCQKKHRDHARKFVEWLLQEYPCRIFDADGRDITERCRPSLDYLYDE